MKIIMPSTNPNVRYVLETFENNTVINICEETKYFGKAWKPNDYGVYISVKNLNKLLQKFSKMMSLI